MRWGRGSLTLFKNRLTIRTGRRQIIPTFRYIGRSRLVSRLRVGTPTPLIGRRRRRKRRVSNVRHNSDLPTIRDRRAAQCVPGGSRISDRCNIFGPWKYTSEIAGPAIIGFEFNRYLFAPRNGQCKIRSAVSRAFGVLRDFKMSSKPYVVKSPFGYKKKVVFQVYNIITPYYNTYLIHPWRNRFYVTQNVGQIIMNCILLLLLFDFMTYFLGAAFFRRINIICNPTQACVLLIVIIYQGNVVLIVNTRVNTFLLDENKS